MEKSYLDGLDIEVIHGVEGQRVGSNHRLTAYHLKPKSSPLNNLSL